MADRDTILQLIEQLYEAATEPLAWPGFLERLATTVGGGVTFLTREADGPAAPPVTVAHGIDASGIASYEAHFCSIDPLQQAVQGEPEGIASFGEPFVARDALVRSEIFNDWYRPNRLETDSIGGVVLRRAGIPSVLGVYQTKGGRSYEREDLELVQCLMPHLNRALQIHHRLGSSARSETLLLSALDGFAFGIVLVDSNGGLVAANSTARALAARKDGLLLLRDEVRATRPGETQLLHGCISRAVQCQSGELAPAGGALRLRREAPHRPLEVVVCPLRPVDDAGLPGEIAAAILVNDPESIAAVTAEQLRELYGLTPREAEVAEAFGAGKTLPEIAEMLGISINTVKARLHEVYAKTGAHRQAELARVLATHAAARPGREA